MTEKTCEICGANYLCRSYQVERSSCCSRYCRNRKGGRNPGRAKRSRPDPKRHRTGPQPRLVESRFWPKVAKGAGCWNWTGALTRGGYGSFWGGPERRAHRMSWVLRHGPIPHGRLVLHRCNNRLCVNPEHLYLGDQYDNMRDMRDRIARRHVHLGEGVTRSVRARV